MTPFSDLTARGRRIEILRWLCVLPAAVLGSVVVQFLGGAVAQVTGFGGRSASGDSNIAYSLSLMLYYVPGKSAFVIAGAKMAPRRQMATAIVLTVLGTLLSLMTHVIGQHLAGNRVGTTNYTHFGLESAGLLGGVGYVLWHDWRKTRGPTKCRSGFPA